MRNHLIMLAGVSALIVACTSNSDQAETAAHDSSASATPATPGSSLDDPTIVAIFDAANTADIETGELAVQRGSSKEVRDFGAMLARDHATVRQQGRDLAGKLGVTPTPPANDLGAKVHADALASLRAKSGLEFDRAFLDHEVKFHQDVIDAVTTTLLPAIQNAELRDLVTRVAPAFEAHRVAAASLRQKLGG